VVSCKTKGNKVQEQSPISYHSFGYAHKWYNVFYIWNYDSSVSTGSRLRQNIIYVWSYYSSVSKGSRLREKAKYFIYEAMTARPAQGLSYGQRQNFFSSTKRPKLSEAHQPSPPTLLFHQCRGIFPGCNEVMGQTVIRTALLVRDLMSVYYIFPLTYSSLENGHNEEI